MEKMGEHTSGPEQIIPYDNYVTCDISSGVKLRMSDNEQTKIPLLSVPGALERAANSVPDQIALAYKENPDDSDFQYITFREYYNLTRTVAKAFLKLGLEKLHSVAIIGFNAPEWFMAYLGCIHAGGVGCGIYTTNSAEATFYCLDKGLANIAVVENDSQVQKILEYKEKLPKLKAIVQYSGKPTAEGVLTWKELLEIGGKEDDEALNEALKRIAINQCCTLIYTSGTTGNPKGVMLSHDNLIYVAQSVASSIDLSLKERIVSYLPLSHAAALVVDIYCHLIGRVSIYFADKDALKGGLVKTLQQVKPTRFLGVPRIWEKIAEKIKAVGTEAGFIKRHIATWARSHGLQRNLDLAKGIDSPSLGYLVAKSLIFSKIKNKLGFDECKTFWTGAAPLAIDIKLFFASLDIPIMEAFGMSESSGPHTANLPGAFNFDSAGKTIPGAKTKIENQNDSEEQGEICLYGRNVFMGYINNPIQTAESIDENGWLHSGDIGKIDENGFLYITGRIKELLITAGGENISPVLIEQNVKAELPFLGQAVVICERKKFLSMLVTLSSEIDGDSGEPKDELTSTVVKWLKDLELPFTTYKEVMASGPDKKILDAIQKGIDSANKKAISNAQKVQKFVILPKDFSVPTGELGPTLKLKRNVINDKYKDIIDKFYDG